MSGSLAMMRDPVDTTAGPHLQFATPADIAFAGGLPQREPAVDFIAQARSKATASVPVSFEDQLETIRSCLDTPFYRVMAEDLREALATSIGWLLHRRGTNEPR